jgi:short-subunit dehydrogenase
MIVAITGASSGIGRAAAVAFAGRGDTVVLAARSRTTLDHVAWECSEAGAKVVVVSPTDVADREQVASLLEQASARCGRVDVVVHCAAVMAYGEFLQVPPEVFERVLRVDIEGTVNVARSSLRCFTGQGGGHLILLGSVISKLAPPFMSSYVMSKWAVSGLARALQTEVRSQPDVEVSLVTPGSVDTPIYQRAGNYIGRVGRPPPPVAKADRVAAAIVALTENPKREVSIGLANPLMEFGFRHLPGLYDVLVTPLMKRLGLSRTPTAPTPGNVFEPHP